MIKTPPFNFLTKAELDSLADEISLEYYPKGVKILAQNGPPSEHLRIIKKGGVKVYLTSEDGREIIIDYRSEGEQFGMLSVVGGDRSRANVVSVEDTICYLIDKDKILSIFQNNPTANEYFMKSFFINYIDKTYDETKRKYTGLSEGDRMLFTTTVGEILKKSPFTSSETVSIQEAATVMAKHKISSLILTDQSGNPTGIVTDRDLRLKVVATGIDISQPANTIMSSPLINIDAGEYCFEALLKMMRHKIHHIVVTDKGAFKGIITNHDLMVLQGSSPTVLVKEMEETANIENLAGTMPKLYKSVGALMREGAKAGHVTGLVTELVEKLINRVIDIIESEIGPAPVKYSVFMCGGGGRRELTLSLGMGLGIIYEDAQNYSTSKTADLYFATMTKHLKDAMAVCRMPKGETGCMSGEHVKSLSDWKDFISHYALTPARIPLLAEMFDMRCIRGEDKPVAAIRAHLYNLASASEGFMANLAIFTSQNRPPLGFFKKFVVEKSGEHRNELNLHEKGLRPLIDSVRFLAIENKITEMPTLRRIAELRRENAASKAEDIEHAFNYLLTLLLHNQLQQVDKGIEPDDFINPDTLSTLERQTLKESFQLTTGLYEHIEKSLKTERAA